MSVVIDGGGLHLDGIAADIRLAAEATPGGPVLRVGIGGDSVSATELGAVAADDGVEAALRLLDVIARSGNDARARDVLATGGSTMFQAVIGDLLIADIAPRRSRCSAGAEAIGTHPLRGGLLARGIGLAFGHADAVVLKRMAKAASDAGAGGIRTAPGRAMMIIGLTHPSLQSFTAAAAELGFIVSADDPRRHVFACAGAPICSSAHIAARAIAPRIAEAAAPYLGASFQIHLSGCAKGCAHAGSTALTIVGAPWRCGLIANGCARDIPFDTVPPDELPAAIVRYAREAKREVSHV